MKKKQKINKAVNSGEWILLGLTALFLCFLFAIRERPAPERGITVRTASSRLPSGPSGDASAVPHTDSASGNADGASDNTGGASGDADSASDAVTPSDMSYASAVTPPADADGRVNINTADLQSLRALPGIGDALAQRIIDYRQEHGPFARPEDVMRVSGIGQGKFDAMKGLITV